VQKTWSDDEINELVRVNVLVAFAAKVVETRVMVPVSLFNVTPFVRLDVCVTVPPAPVA